MPPILVSSSSLRRLLAAVLTLSVLFTTLGWMHAPCDGSTAPHEAASPLGAAPVNGHGSGTGGVGSPRASDETAHDVPVRPSPRHVPAEHGHSGASPTSCALVAHCAVAVIATVTTVAAPEVAAATQPPVPRDGRRLEPSVQPDSPPPKG